MAVSQPRGRPPVVGITGYLLTADSAAQRVFDGGEQALFALNYFSRALAFDMLPLAVPPVSARHAGAYLELVDGLIFTGGSDVDPGFYGREPHPRLGPIVRGRDEFELRMARLAVSRGVPILGICRGMQLLNVALGGSLEQHLETEVAGLRHGSGTHVPEFHEVEVLDRELGDLVGSRVTVNSLHHQAVLDLSDDLRAAACSPDGVLEAAVGIANPVLGVQWHPERMPLGDPAADAPFRWLRSRLAAAEQRPLADSVPGGGDRRIDV
jgi:putative glutamine amidotransferase